MRRLAWNEGWKYWNDKDSFALVWNVPENARDITLPHDAMIEDAADEMSPNGGNTGFRNAECYTYVKLFKADEAMRGKKVIVRFDGVYMNAMIYLNGQFVAKGPFGYTTVYADLTDHLRMGEENELRVLVRAGAMANSRWYSGAGIYRDVWLMISDKSRILPEGICPVTERIGEGYAVLKVLCTVENGKDRSGDFIIRHEIMETGRDKALLQNETPVFLGSGERRELMSRMIIDSPKLWDEEHPDLYRIVTSLIRGDKVVDSDETVFGIRTLALDARRGMQVNGNTVKLRGACIHHDSGMLGAATYKEVHYRQVKKLKEAGFNAIRMSHHPAASALLDACDELGMYVMDELSDMWNRMKSGYDYGLYFEEWWRQDAEAMVRKDRAHPSVVLYSIGNEIPEIGTESGSKYAHDISAFFHELDPYRYTTAGINGVFAAGDHVPEIVEDIASGMEDRGEGGNVNDFMTLMDGHMDEIVTHRRVSERIEKAVSNLDVAGYNYMAARYEPDGRDYPDRVIVGSETYPPDIARNWELVQRLPHVIGDFTWTGWDYIGEAGVGIPAYKFGDGGFGARYPAQLAYCGDIDITGFRRPASYFREIVFGLRSKPYIAVQDPAHYGENLIKTPWVMSDSIHSWTFRGLEGKPVIVEVYAGGDEVELLINGKSVGRKPSGALAGYRVYFETSYESGKLTAVVYENGAELSRQELETAGEFARLILEKEDNEGAFDYYNITLEDDKGHTVTDRDVKLTLTSGEGILLGSGDPKPMYGYDSGTAMTFKGRAQVIAPHGAGFEIRTENGITSAAYPLKDH